MSPFITGSLTKPVSSPPPPPPAEGAVNFYWKDLTCMELAGSGTMPGPHLTAPPYTKTQILCSFIINFTVVQAIDEVLVLAGKLLLYTVLRASVTICMNKIVRAGHQLFFFHIR